MPKEIVTVRDLITSLQKLDQDARVFSYWDMQDDVPISGIMRDKENGCIYLHCEHDQPTQFSVGDRYEILES